MIQVSVCHVNSQCEYHNAQCMLGRHALETLCIIVQSNILIPQWFTFSDVASSLPKHFPHHDQITWLCRLLSKEESEKLLRGRIDETFLVRATDLSGPNHLFTVDIL